MPTSLTLALTVSVLSGRSTALGYTLRTTYDATNFFEAFNFRDAAYYNAINPDYEGDPTNGSVTYLSQSEAMKAGIAKIENNKVFLGVDSTKIANYRGDSEILHGRESVRLESKETWSSGILIADVEHMPGTACGVWPALWLYNNSEDPVGEIDLVEGVNEQDSNVVSLHTCGRCTFANIGGLDERANCNNGGTESSSCEDGTNFDGCGSTMPLGSYGKRFNKGAGGVFAIWLLPDALRVYWWKRDAVPADVLTANPDPNTWGTPTSQFLSGDGCNVGDYFKKQTLIINTAFCGENIPQSVWEETCLASTGFQTCDDYITQNPEAFVDSYWLFNSINIYDTVDA